MLENSLPSRGLKVGRKTKSYSDQKQQSFRIRHNLLPDGEKKNVVWDFFCGKERENGFRFLQDFLIIKKFKRAI